MKRSLRRKLAANVRVIAPERAMSILRVASVLAIVALGMMMWSLVDPMPAPVLLALSFGQLLGTISFMAFLVIIGWDRYRQWRARKQRENMARRASQPDDEDAAEDEDDEEAADEQA
ncbi:MAG: hypothetical protein HOO96_09325 [Polyangiaceae bacterium]|nr:hypothetical protein [Polyangiaceae bacterium]